MGGPGGVRKAPPLQGNPTFRLVRCGRQWRHTQFNPVCRCVETTPKRPGRPSQFVWQVLVARTLSHEPSEPDSCLRWVNHERWQISSACRRNRHTQSGPLFARRPLRPSAVATSGWTCPPHKEGSIKPASNTRRGTGVEQALNTPTVGGDGSWENRDGLWHSPWC